MLIVGNARSGWSQNAVAHVERTPVLAVSVMTTLTRVLVSKIRTFLDQIRDSLHIGIERNGRVLDRQVYQTEVG